MSQEEFLEIVQFIQQSRYNALKTVNAELINLYWNLGKYISCKLASAKWGEKKIEELSSYIQKNYPELKSFHRRGFYRMKQFYDTYASASFNFRKTFQLAENKKNVMVTSLRTQFEDIRNSLLAKLSWTHHRTIFSRCKSEEEAEFYIRASIENNYTVRELDRQISASLFERTMLSDCKLPDRLQSENLNFIVPLKNSYVFEFLNLSENHNERELQQALVHQMKDFILELGKDFIFIGEEYKLSVGSSDFFIDLLFFHRGLQCLARIFHTDSAAACESLMDTALNLNCSSGSMKHTAVVATRRPPCLHQAARRLATNQHEISGLVAFELKADKFKPEYLGQLNFYLEALDRDVRKQNENPSIGILLCKDKDREVVEYALSRTLSPTMAAEYKTQLPDKKLLQAKLRELFENKERED